MSIKNMIFRPIPDSISKLSLQKKLYGVRHSLKPTNCLKDKLLKDQTLFMNDPLKNTNFKQFSTKFSQEPLKMLNFISESIPKMFKYLRCKTFFLYKK